MENLKTKDLISIGIFGAMYIIVMMVIVTAAGMVPILYVVAPFFVGIVCATVYMLFVMRVPKRGAVLILSVLISILFLATTWIASAFVIFCGIIAEVILSVGNRKSIKTITLSYMVFACSTVGPYLSIIISRSAYIQTVFDYYGQEYADKMDALTPSWIILPLLLITVISGYIGSNIGAKILKKHFKKAGVI